VKAIADDNMLETYRGTVYPWQCDHMGHMNVMWYTGKFDEASWNLLALMGLSTSALREQGSAMVAVEQHLQYKKELFAGDVLRIRSRVLEVGGKSIRFVHEMRHGLSGELCATSHLVGVHIDAEARKARPLPEAVAARAREMLEHPEPVAR
jgi:acyl-CoA thioester hydrolase